MTLQEVQTRHHYELDNPSNLPVSPWSIKEGMFEVTLSCRIPLVLSGAALALCREQGGLAELKAGPLASNDPFVAKRCYSGYVGFFVGW